MAIDINIPSQIKTYANLAGFPATGSLKTIFIAEDTNKTYRWTGSAYVEISASQATAWGAITGTLSAQTDLNTALSGKVPTTRTLTINGTTQDLSADRTFTVSTGITIGTTAITSGTVGRVLFEGTGNVVQESAGLFWDNTNGRLGIGGTPSTFNLDVVGTARVQGNTTISLNQNGVTLINASNTTSGTASTAELRATTGGGFIGLGKYSASTNSYKFIASSDSYLYSATIGDIAIINDFASGRIKFGAGASSTAQATLFSTGNFAINTTTDAGFKLDVNGSGRYIGTGSNALLLNGDGLSVNAQNHKVALSATTNGITRMYLTSTASGASFNTGFALVSGTTSKWSLASYGTTSDFTFYNDALTSDALFIKGNTNNVIIGSTTDVASALLNVTSTTKGFLPPRMTTTQRNAIASPATGLIVYDTTLNLPHFYNGTIWVSL